MKKTTKQQGFTLIELMIVVAVIGVLAAVALPQYQKYIAKTELASALATLSGLRVNAEAYTLEMGSFPTNAQSAAIGVPITAMGNIQLDSPSSNAGGTITFEFDGDVSPHFNKANDKLVLERNATSGVWSCSKTLTNGDLSLKNC